MVGGGTALLSHLVKAGSRLAINSSPEPVTNIGASLAEDITVFALVWFAIEHPRAAAAIAAVLLVLGLTMLYFVAKLVRRGWRRWKRRRDPTRQPRAARRMIDDAGHDAEPPASRSRSRPASSRRTTGPDST